MSSYGFLAGCYDALTYDVDYAAWADYIEKHFARRPLPGKTVLDLACGTGSLTRELALRGYEMIGVDQSPEMLAQAAEKNREGSPIEPIFLCQRMEKLDQLLEELEGQKEAAASDYQTLQELLEQEGAYTAEYDALMETWETLSTAIQVEEGSSSG